MKDKEFCRKYLEQCAAINTSFSGGVQKALSSLAKAASGVQPVEEEILLAMDYIYVRNDCGDFVIANLLRMIYLFGESELISKKIKQAIKEMLLDFDYWFGENVKFPGRQIIWTENHIMMFMTCEYLAAQLYPDETFRFRKKKGSEICREIAPKILEWIKIKGLVGFSEWDSNCYIEENVYSLLNIYDFARDDILKEKANRLLDIMMFGMAVNSFKGNYCCSHGRSYASFIKHSGNTGVAIMQKLLWDIGNLGDNLLSMGGISIATSQYDTCSVIDRIATDSSSVFEDKEQQSFDVEDGIKFNKGFHDFEDLTLYWHNMGYTHRDIAKRTYEMGVKFGIVVNKNVYTGYRYVKECKEKGIEPDKCKLGNYMCRVSKITYKTPDYLISCAQDFRKGEDGYQQHIWQATMEDDAIVFTNHPGTYNEGDGRPDFWSGNAIHPRAAQYKNMVICIYNIDRECRIPYSHAYFPQKKFDEVIEAEGWIFGRKGEGYVALYSQNGYQWSERNALSDVEAICKSPSNIWICHMGNKAQYSAFNIFINNMLLSEIIWSDNEVNFNSPEHGWIRYGWEGALMVNGEDIKVSGYKRFDNPYCQSDYFSGKYEINYGEDRAYIQI